MNRLTRHFIVFISIVLSAFLFDIISTYYALLFPRFGFEHNPYARWFIQYFGKQIGLLAYFFIRAAIYVGILFLFDLSKFHITEGTFSISLGFGHFLAGISNISVYLDILWIHFALIDFLLLYEEMLLIPTILIFLVEFYLDKKRKSKYK
jgi:hypothetical protein